MSDKGPTRATYDLMEELKLLDPGQVRFFYDEFEELCMEDGAGGRQGPLTVRRAFPVSAAGDYIAVRLEKGDEELGVVRHLTELDQASREALETELERTYFTPKITAVRAIVTQYHVPHWEVETDRGPRSFELHSSRRDLRVMAGGRVLLRDADGNRYEIPDYRKLDAASLALIEPLV